MIQNNSRVCHILSMFHHVLIAVVENRMEISDWISIYSVHLLIVHTDRRNTDFQVHLRFSTFNFSTDEHLTEWIWNSFVMNEVTFHIVASASKIQRNSSWNVHSFAINVKLQLQTSLIEFEIILNLWKLNQFRVNKSHLRWSPPNMTFTSHSLSLCSEWWMWLILEYSVFFNTGFPVVHSV